MTTAERAIAKVDKAPTTSIGRRILVRSLAVGLIPLILLGFVVFIGLNDLNNTAVTRADESREVLSEESVVVASQEQAVSVSREINVVLNERIRDVQAWARSSEIVSGATSGASDASEQGLTRRTTDQLEEQFADSKALSSTGAARTYLNAELSNNRDFGEIFFTESHGYNVSYTSQTSDFVQSDEEWWTNAWENGLDLSDVAFDESAGVFSVDIAVRIEDPNSGRALGVLKTSLGIGFVQTIADERSGDAVDYTIALGDGRMIAETESNHSPQRMMGFSSSPGLATAIQERSGSAPTGTLIDDEFVYGYTTTLDPSRFESLGYDNFGGFDWLIVSTQTADTAFAPLRGLEALKADISDAGTNLRTLIILFLLVGIAIAFLMARKTAQGIVRPIQELTTAASTAAETGLPTAVNEINAEGADLDSVEAPSVRIETGDELETLASAFNSVQASAVRLAAEQAASRRNTSEMFVNLGRRNQSLLKRQLRFIDSLEQSEENPDTLESLFKLDHLATRMRRNAESLLVLAGDRSPRRWAAPVEVRTAVESALAEVESYERVDLSGVTEGEMMGNVVADVAHILAEVIENGLNFSPPTAEVFVAGRMAGDDYILTVVDHGLGMKPAEIDVANERLSTVTELTKVPSQYLGLFVVARLAQRHGIAVTLTDAPSGGLSVRIVLPAAILHQEVVEEEAAPEESDAPISALDLPGDVTLDDDPEIARAEVEVYELLAKAEQALAKVEGIRADRSKEDIAEEEAANTRRAMNEANPPARRAEDKEPPRPITNQPVTEPVHEPATPIVTASNEAPVDVGGMQFARRAKKTSAPQPAEAQARRTTDAAIKPTADEAAPDLAQFGFKRRESKRDEPVSSNQPMPAGVGAAPVENENVEVVAAKSRNQWSSFQRGKQQAESVVADNE